MSEKKIPLKNDRLGMKFLLEASEASEDVDSTR